MTQTINYLYDFDRTGVSKNNRIRGELHTVTNYVAGEFRYIVPRCAPFFAMNYEVYLIEAGSNNKIKLERYVHYAESHPYSEITNCLQKYICGSISITDSTISGTLSIEYNCLGGPFTIDSAKILSILANKLVDPVTVDWSAVANVPDKFPPEAHYHPAENLGEFGKLVEAVKANTEAMVVEQETNSKTLEKHLKDKNPHGITLNTIGAPHIRNTRMATSADVEAGSDALAIITAASLGYFSRYFNLKPNSGNSNQNDLIVDGLRKELNEIKKKISNIQNLGVANGDNELIESANNLYARVADVYKIIRKMYATKEQGLNKEMMDRILTPSVLHAVLDEFIPIGAMFYLPRAYIKSSRCVIPNGARFNSAVYPDLRNYLGEDILPGAHGLFIKSYNPGGMNINDVGRVYDGTGALQDVWGNVNINLQQSGGVGSHFHIMHSTTSRNGKIEQVYFAETPVGMNPAGVNPYQGQINRACVETKAPYKLGRTNNGRLEDNDGGVPDGGNIGTYVTRYVATTSLPILNNSNGSINVVTGDSNINSSTTANLNLEKRWVVPEPRHILLNLVMRAK